MNIRFFRLLPVIANWFPHKKTVIDGQYVDKVVFHVSRYYPLQFPLVAANDNETINPTTPNQKTLVHF